MDRQSSRPSPRGQHYLRPSHAESFVAGLNVRRNELILDIGAGKGALTRPLAERGARVLAIERDRRLADLLRHRFTDAPHVKVIEADVLTMSLPRRPFRTASNIPFGITTSLIRKLLEPGSALERADLIVGYGAARKRTARNLLTMSVAPWYTMKMGPRLQRTCFDPPPSCDASILTIVRRVDALLPEQERARFEAFLRNAFDRSNSPVVGRLGIPPRQFKRLARTLDIPRDARPVDLSILEWIELYRQRAGGRSRAVGRAPTQR